MEKTKSSVHLIRQVTSVGRNRQVMTEYIILHVNSRGSKNGLRRKKHNVGNDVKNKENFFNF